jgi:CheY-like chemotaxis protein
VSATLLLADDSPTIHRLVELTFAHEDIRVVSVSDGAAAVAQIDSVRPDIVLADVGMPRLTGYDVAGHIKRTPALKHIPVLLLTGAFDPIDPERARDCGSDGSLVKPFEPQQLIARVKELLAAHRHEAPRPALSNPAAGTSIRSTDIPLTAGGARDASAVVPTASSGPAVSGAPIPLSASAQPASVTSNRGDVGQPPPHSADPGFERELEELSAEFGNLGATGGSGSRKGSAQEFGGWDLPEPPTPHQDLAVSSAPSGSAAPHGSAGAAGRVSLASAFSALLAAEQAQPTASRPSTQMSEAAIEEVVRRVLLRMTEDSVRRIVLETAERLIREEIENIKANPT